METKRRFGELSNEELDKELVRLVGAERAVTVRLITCLDEFDVRRRYLSKGFNSLYAYCVEALHLGDGAAWRRIRAVKIARRFPVVLDMMENLQLRCAAHNVYEADVFFGQTG